MAGVSVIDAINVEGNDENPKTSSSTGPEVTKEERLLLKRLPRRLPKRKNDIYVTRKTCFKTQLCRCDSLLNNNFNEIFIHGLGAAVSRAVNLALQLKLSAHGSLDVSCQTDSIHLTDDILYDDEDDAVGSKSKPSSQSRINSAVHIRVFRPDVPLSLEDVQISKEFNVI